MAGDDLEDDEEPAEQLITSCVADANGNLDCGTVQLTASAEVDGDQPASGGGPGLGDVLGAGAKVLGAAVGAAGVIGGAAVDALTSSSSDSSSDS